MKQSVKKRFPHNWLTLIAKRDNLVSQIKEYDKSLSTPQYFSPGTLTNFRKTRANLNKQLTQLNKIVKPHEKALLAKIKTTKEV